MSEPARARAHTHTRARAWKAMQPAKLRRICRGCTGEQKLPCLSLTHFGILNEFRGPEGPSHHAHSCGVSRTCLSPLTCSRDDRHVLCGPDNGIRRAGREYLLHLPPLSPFAFRDSMPSLVYGPKSGTRLSENSDSAALNPRHASSLMPGLGSSWCLKKVINLRSARQWGVGRVTVGDYSSYVHDCA